MLGKNTSTQTIDIAETSHRCTEASTNDNQNIISLALPTSDGGTVVFRPCCSRAGERRLKWLSHIRQVTESLEEFIRGSQVAKDQEEDHGRDGWTVLKKTLEEPVYQSSVK